MTALRGNTMPAVRRGSPSWSGLWQALRRRLTVSRRDAVPDAEVWRSAARAMAHDLRAPAATLLALADLQRLGALPAEAFAEQVARQARHALALTDAVAALLHEPLHAYQLVPLDLVELLRQRLDAAERCHQVSVRLADSRAAWIMADARMLGEAVDMVVDRLCIGYGGAEDGCGDVRIRVAHTAAGVELAIRAPDTDDTAARALSAAAPAGLLVRRVLHRHGGALHDGGAHPPGGMREWRLILPALPAGRRQAPNKKAPEGAFLPSVA